MGEWVYSRLVISGWAGWWLEIGLVVFIYMVLYLHLLSCWHLAADAG
jgi:hypothetical protein